MNHRSTPLGSSLARLPFTRPAAVNRRAFLRAGAVAIGLPFLEGLPERSAWAADAPPVFSLFIVTANGVVQNKFFPNATGPLDPATLAGMTDKATSVLAPHAANLLFIKGLDFPASSARACSHAEGSCQTLTAAPPGSNGNAAYSSGPSADVVIAQAVNPAGVEPLTLYSGQKGYIAERISFQEAGAGQIRAAETNPYTLYAQLVGLADPNSGAVDPLAAELVSSRKSVNDLVREQLRRLQGLSSLSADDQQRLQQHFDAIRDAEVTLGEMGSACSEAGLATSQLQALESGFAFRGDMMEDVVKLHLELVALAFACNFNRVATLQHGDGTDGTKYSVPSNAELGGWSFHQISHRIQSDSATGANPTAELAHAEIDVVRLRTLLHGLDHFQARGLLDKSIIMWTSNVADGPSHSFKNVPHIIAGSGGGYLKPGAFVDVGGVTNNKLFNALINAAIRDKMSWTENFGQGTGTGELTEILA